MATYTLISSNVLSSSAASVTFSAIPATYTDLVLRVSARADDTGLLLQMTLNSATSTYSNTLLLGNGSTVSSTRNTGQAYLRAGYVNPSGSTASTFSSGEIYIPNYNSTIAKPMSSLGMTENNASTAYIANYANLWDTSSAITSITLDMTASGQNFVSGSSFYLYGISNA
jgi:hypothetical protein